MEKKQLRRSKSDAVLGGVASGMANYFNIDVVIVRLLFVVSLLVGFGVPLFAYIVLWVVLPEEPVSPVNTQNDSGDLTVYQAERFPQKTKNRSDRNLKVIAIGLILFGVYMLLDEYLIWYNLHKYFWPAALIGLGIFLLLRNREKDEV